MAIYLVQHGKSLTKQEDPEQGLSEDGKKEVRLIAGVAKNYGVSVPHILHSGKKRAQETALIMAEELDSVREVASIPGLKPLDKVSTLVDTLLSDNTMYVGHLPFMEKLTSHLVTGTDEFLVMKFQNGGIVCLDQEENGSWYIKWTLMPDIS